MKLDELILMSAQGETETIEFKKSTNLMVSAFTSLCGFLNNEGGTVVFGVAAARVLGQQVTDSTMQEIASHIRKIEPAASVKIEVIDVVERGTHAVVVSCTPNPGLKPYAYDGRAWERIGTSTSVMSQSRYQELLLERAHSSTRWEIAPAPRHLIEDLDEDLFPLF